MSTNRPGVEISQELAETPSVSVNAELVPAVVGVCYQIVDVLDDDGALNPEARYTGAQYNQADLTITQAELPDPRGNIDELDVVEDSVYAHLYFGGTLERLSRSLAGDNEYGSAFLKLANFSTRPGFISSEFDSFAFNGVTGDVFTFALDLANPLVTSRDITVTLVGTLTAAEVVEAINTAAGQDVAEVFVDTEDQFGNGSSAAYVSLRSRSWGADASVTIRAGTSALPILFGSTVDDTLEYRIEGAGWRGQDDSDNDLLTPWIEFFRGEYSEDGTDTTFPTLGTSNVVYAVQHTQDGSFVADKSAAVTFTGTSPTIPLKAATARVPGDQFWAEGTQVGSEVTRVEESRFQVGRLSVTSSTFDNEGNPTNRVYDTVEVATPNAGTPFAPKYAYFVAGGLEFDNISPEGVQAQLTGSNTGRAERAAQVISSSDITFPLSAASLTLIFEVTEDGVQGDEVTFTFTGGPYSNISELVSAMSGDEAFSQITVGNAGDRLLLSTTKMGADQSLTIKPEGTANAALNFSTTAATSDTGKDHEFATQAALTSDTIALPMADLSSLDFSLTVTDSKGTHSLSASGVDLSSASTLGDIIDAIAEAFGGTASSDLTLYDGGSASGEGGIAVATLSTSGDSDTHGTITVTTVEGGSAVSLELTAVDGDDGFRQLGFYDSTGGQWAELDSAAGTSYPIAALSGAAVEFTYNDGSSTVVTATLGASEAAATSAEELAELLNANADANGITASSGTRLVQWYSDDDDVISVRSVEGGATVSLSVASGQAGFDEMGFDVSSTLSDSGTDSVENADGVGANSLQGSSLSFQLDDNPSVYQITFATNSLQDAIDDINDLVDGSSDVASESSGALRLTSILAGAASRVQVLVSSSTAASVLGFAASTNDDALGSGRPNPDFYLDASGNLNLGPNILRNRSSGLPYSLESAFASVYVKYKALRHDVTASADTPAILSLGDTASLVESIGPISPENPLGLGAFVCKAAAPGVEISALGVDERSASSPEGTLDGWARALDFLESAEVYALAPLTSDRFVQGMVAAHVTAMSQPRERGERVALLWSPNPDRAFDTTVASGVAGETNGTENSFTLDSNPGASLIANGIDPSDTIPYDDELYLEVVVMSGGSQDLRRYSVSEVNGVILTFRTTFSSEENTDGFYTTSVLDESLSGAEWTLRIRGEKLVIAGTENPDKAAIADAMADEAQAMANRRVFLMACNSLDLPIDGVTQNVPGYYAAAAVAGMTGRLRPQQPFSELPMPGFVRVYGTDDTFSNRQLDVVSDGGRWVLVNRGNNVAALHARSTSDTSIEAREYSVTKALDWLAKGLRQTNRVFTGRSVLTPGFLDQLTMSNEGFLDYAESLGVVETADLSQLLQSEEDPDTVLIEVEVKPAYPCNKIKLTIVS